MKGEDDVITGWKNKLQVAAVAHHAGDHGWPSSTASRPSRAPAASTDAHACLMFQVRRVRPLRTLSCLTSKFDVGTPHFYRKRNRFTPLRHALQLRRVAAACALQ